jgi:hypothetical protein
MSVRINMLVKEAPYGKAMFSIKRSYIRPSEVFNMDVTCLSHHQTNRCDFQGDIPEEKVSWRVTAISDIDMLSSG